VPAPRSSTYQKSVWDEPNPNQTYWLAGLEGSKVSKANLRSSWGSVLPSEASSIEGHTDAVGSDIDNLSLSDRRAEAVAVILTDTFAVPAENLTTQGYGEQFLRMQTEFAARENRRVAIRRITPLLAKEPTSF
jgi:OmpA family